MYRIRTRLQGILKLVIVCVTTENTKASVLVSGEDIDVQVGKVFQTQFDDARAFVCVFSIKPFRPPAM